MEKNKKVIGFAGRKRSGKTTICEYLKETESAEIITIADALKNLCKRLLELQTIDDVNKLKNEYYPFNLIQNDDGTFLFYPNLLKIEHYHNFQAYPLSKNYDFKSTILEETGIKLDAEELNGFENITNMRELLQYVGTDIIRKHDPDWHCKQLKKAIEKSNADIVVVDDVRFPNERSVIEEFGGTVFFVIRPNVLDVSNHESETSLHWQDFADNRVIVNISTIERMNKNIHEYIGSGYAFGNDNGSLKSGLYTFEFHPYKLNFGRKHPSNKDEAYFIKKHIVKNKLFKNTGIINIWIDDKKDFEICQKYLFSPQCARSVLANGMQLTFYNPFIIENLKEWL